MFRNCFNLTTHRSCLILDVRQSAEAAGEVNRRETNRQSTLILTLNQKIVAGKLSPPAGDRRRYRPGPTGLPEAQPTEPESTSLTLHSSQQAKAEPRLRDF